MIKVRININFVAPVCKECNEDYSLLYKGGNSPFLNEISEYNVLINKTATGFNHTTTGGSSTPQTTRPSRSHNKKRPTSQSVS